MILEHLFEHGIRRGFSVIQECHSAFLGAYRAPLVAGGGCGVVRRPGPRRTAHGYFVRGRACLGRLTTPLAATPRAAACGGWARAPPSPDVGWRECCRCGQRPVL